MGEFLYRRKTFQITENVYFKSDVEMYDGHILEANVRYPVISRYLEKYVIICVGGFNEQRFYVIRTNMIYFASSTYNQTLDLKLSKFVLDTKSNSLCRFVGNLYTTEIIPEDDKKYIELNKMKLIFSSSSDFGLCVVNDYDFFDFIIPTNSNKRHFKEFCLVLAILSPITLILKCDFGIFITIPLTTILVLLYLKLLFINNIDPLNFYKLSTKIININGVDYYYKLDVEIKYNRTQENYNIFYRDSFRLNHISCVYVNNIPNGNQLEVEESRIDTIYTRIVTDNFKKNGSKYLRNFVGTKLNPNGVYRI